MVREVSKPENIIWENLEFAQKTVTGRYELFYIYNAIIATFSIFTCVALYFMQQKENDCTDTKSGFSYFDNEQQYCYCKNEN